MPFKKGQSGNPGGRRKRTKEDFDLIAAARARAPEALTVITDLMANSSNDRVRLSAAVALLERGFGTVAAVPAGADDVPPMAVPVKRVDASVPEA